MSEKLLNRREIEQMLNIGRSSVFRYLKEQGFPEPIRLSARSLRWRESEVQAWIESRKGAKCKNKAKPVENSVE